MFLALPLRRARQAAAQDWNPLFSRPIRLRTVFVLLFYRPSPIPVFRVLEGGFHR